MHIFIQEINAGTALSNDAIWDKFSDQHQHQNTKKALYSMPNLQILVEWSYK